MSEINDEWKHNKKVRELSQEIEQFELHAKREIENNKKCHPNKIKHSKQNFLKILKQRYKDFTGIEYDDRINE